MTNVTRLLGRKMGSLCFALDVLKGLAPVLAAGIAGGYIGRKDLSAGEVWAWLAVAAAAVIGHVFPVWLGFRGGKGVATALGVLLGFWPMLTLPGLAALLTWVLLVTLFRYVSLASMIAAITLPLYVLAEATLTATPIARLLPFLIVTSFLVLVVLARHHANIRRLLAGTENKIVGRDGWNRANRPIPRLDP